MKKREVVSNNKVTFRPFPGKFSELLMVDY